MIKSETARAVSEIKKADQASSKAEKSFKGMALSLAKAAAPIAAAAVGFRALIKNLKESVELAGIQEEAELALQAALVATGKEAEISAEGIQQLASELQGVTTFGDEATIQAAALAQQLGDLTEGQLRRAIPQIQNFAAAMGMDLNGAAQLVGKSIGSTTNALTRYGVEIDNSLRGSERADAVIEQLDSKFGGFAETVADSATGNVQQFSNAMGDLKEVGGEAILDFLDPAVTSLTQFVQGITNAITEAREYKDLVAGEAEEVSTLSELRSRQETIVARIAEEEANIADQQSKANSLSQNSLDSLRNQLRVIDQRIAAEEYVAELRQRGSDAAEEQAEAEARAAARQADALELLDFWYSKTERAQIAALEADLQRMRGFEKQGEMTVAAIQLVEQQLAALKGEADESPVAKSMDEATRSARQAMAAIQPIDTVIMEAADEADEFAENVAKIKSVTNDVAMGFNSAMGAVNAFAANADRRAENNIAKMEEELEVVRDRFEREIEFAKAAGASESELAALKRQQAEEEAAAQDKLDRKKADLARKQFKRQKALNIAQALMDTASAVAQALPNIPLSVTVGALGAAQVTAISSQEPPAFERGGSFVTDGPQTIQVGDGQSPRERVTVEPLTGPYSGGSGGITINISGVIGGREQVADWVNEGIRRGRARGKIRS